MRAVLTYRLPDATKITLRPARPDDAAAIIAAVRSSSQERSYVLMEIYGKDAATQRAYIERLDRGHNLFHDYPRLEADIFTTNEHSLHLFEKAGFREDTCRRRSVRVGVQQINEIILARALR